MVVVAPPATKTVTRVIPIKTRLRRNVAEGPISLVAHHEVGRPVLRVVVRRWIFVLICTAVVDVQAKINVQPPVTIVVSHGRARESPLRSVGKLKCVRPEAKLSFALVEKQ